MKAYQVYRGTENKHGFQEYDLQSTYLSREKALEHAQKIVDETPLYGDTLIDEGWCGDEKFRSWTAHGLTSVCICKIEEIEMINMNYTLAKD
jgi:hypothetical protein